MRVVVLNIAAKSGGALTILKDFYQYIRENDTSNEWIFLLSDYYIEDTDNITVEVIKNSTTKIERLKLDNFSGHRLINQYKPDVVFSMQNTTIANLSVPQVLYLHQSIPFQSIKNYSFFKKEEFKYAIIQHLLGANIKYGLRRADTLIVQTNWMKEVIMDQTDDKSIKIEVIPPSININNKNRNENKKYNYKSFFYPSGSALYKNNDIITQSCNYIDRIYPNLQYSVDITVDEEFNNSHIQSLGTITREKVLKKLSSEVLIFPSYIETFGLPLAEGRALNSLILASDTSFSREVLYGYENAYFFNPFNEEELARLMIRSIKGDLLKKYETKDYSVSKNSWERVYDVLLSFK